MPTQHTNGWVLSSLLDTTEDYVVHLIYHHMARYFNTMWLHEPYTDDGYSHFQAPYIQFLICCKQSSTGGVKVYEQGWTWKGYYEQYGSKHEMTCSLTFSQDGTVSGQGSDDIGRYTISGKMETSNSFAFTKQYVGAHSVAYSGTVQWGDLPKLQGLWQLGGQSGGFMLYPVAFAVLF